MASLRRSSSTQPEHATRRRRVRLRIVHTSALQRYLGWVAQRTNIVAVVLLLIALWLGFSAAYFLAENGAAGASIATYGDALYWGVAAMSTAGIAGAPVTPAGQAIGAAWIVLGSFIFFGTIVASITGYFMRPTQRPVRQIIETIEYNLEHLDDLSVEELELLKKTTDGLIGHVEQLKQRQAGAAGT